MHCEAFLHGFDLTDTIAVFTGPSPLPFKTGGVVKTYIYFDDNVKPCSLHVLGVDNNTFLIRGKVMCNFYQVTLKPQESSEDWNWISDWTELRVCYKYPSYWKFSHSIIITTCVACGSQLFIYFVCSYWTFEEKSALLIGCTVSSTDNPQIIVMNPDTYSKSVYKAQTVGLATEVKNHMSSRTLRKRP